MTTALTDLDDLQAWTTYLQGLAAYTGDPTFINNFNWTSIQTMTVGQYLSLLDQVETFLSTYNWSALAAYLPVLEAQLLQQGLPQSVIDEAIGVLEDFVSGDFSLIEDAFDFVRAELALYPNSTLLTDAIAGIANVGVFKQGASGDDTLLGTKYADILDGRGGDDDIVGRAGNDVLKGGAGRDKVDGGGGRDLAYGGGQNDKVLGGDGNDVVAGGSGRDIVKGGAGRDKVVGGKGNDILFGNAGADKFVFLRKDGSDIIRDFQLEIDAIKIANTASLADITFQKSGTDVVLTAGALEVTVEDVTVAALKDADNFIF